MPGRPAHWVYLARCADGSFYCGYARDPRKRIAAHNAGIGSKSVRGKLPVRLAFARSFRSKGDALRFEAAVKRRSHAEKGALSREWRARVRVRRARARV